METPSVVFFRNKYYMFYTGYPTDQNNANEFRIQMATSLDGISWQRTSFQLGPSDPSNTTPNLDFNQWVVAEPGALVFHDKIYLYYSALGASAIVNTTLQTIGVVTSDDGISWSAQKIALSPDQNLSPRNQNWKGYSTPSAVVINGEVNLFFNVVTDLPFRQLRFHRATSNNGEAGWNLESQAILDLGRSSDVAALTPWATMNLMSPTVVSTKDKAYLFFSGHGDTSLFPNVKMGIGLITCQ